MITMMITKDDDKGDDKKLKDQSKNNSSESKNNSSESRTIQEFKIESRRRKLRVKNQDSRFKISRIKIKIQDSRFKNQEKA